MHLAALLDFTTPMLLPPLYLSHGPVASSFSLYRCRQPPSTVNPATSARTEPHFCLQFEFQFQTILVPPNSSPLRLKGKVAIITGGASGFGEVIVRLFVRHGAKVIIADVQDQKGIALCNDITSSTNDCDNSSISYGHCNVTDDTDVKNLVDIAISKYDKLDIMFNNAGIAGDLDKTVLGTTNENFKRVFDVNVYGAFLGAKHAARVMIPRKSGVILFTASMASVVCGETSHEYTMSKHAIIGLMKNLCVEMGQYGIRVNAISPGPVSTPILTHPLGIDKATLDEVITESAILKGVTPDPMNVANAALYLASDEAKLVHGLNLMIDGGYSVTNPSFSLAFKRLLP